MDLPLFILFAGIFTLPGWPMARWFAGGEADRLTRTILALPFGYLAGATACGALRLLGVSSPIGALAACAGLGVVLAWTSRRRPAGIVALTRLDTVDGIALSLLWLLAVAIVGPVFALVGDVTPAGLAYRTGPVGAMSYTLEIAENLAFSATVAIVTMSEQASETRFTIAQQLKASTKYYWRVRGFDSNAASSWSLTQSFVTPAPVAAPTPSPSPTPAPGAACNSSNPDTIIKRERAKYGHMNEGQLLEFVRASAKSLNRNAISGSPFGILCKSGGSSCGGFACDIICAGQGTSQRQYDVLGDAEGAQDPGWGPPKTYPNIRVDVCEIQ